MRKIFARTIFVVLVCLGMLSSPVLADFKNFGVYQDTNPNGRLDPGDKFLGGVMSWLTMYSAASSYNYSKHKDDPALPELTGAPYAIDYANSLLSEDDKVFSWLPMEDDELYLYMVWSDYDNTEHAPELSGFSLGLIANDYQIGRTDPDPSGGFHLNIAVRNDDSSGSVPQVTLSDDYVPTNADDPGRPTSPGYQQNGSQEFYKTAVDTAPGALYNHFFEGIWNYTASTGDGGVIGGINNGEYDITYNPDNDNIVTEVIGDGLVIRIDPEDLGEITNIVIWDFGYSAEAVDTPGVMTPPAHYTWFPQALVIPIGTEMNKTFFIASIPEVIPEPSGLLSLLILGGVAILGRRRRKNRI